MKKFLRFLMNKSFFIKSVAFIISLYLRFVYITTSWRYMGQKYPQKFIEKEQPFIACFWHGRLAMLAFAWKWKKVSSCYMLISSHRDGQLISQTVGMMGIKSFSGSSSKKGTEAFRKMISLLRKKQFIGITPDGPKGPAFKIKEGLIKAAYLTQVPILPVTFSTSKRKIMGSWDKLILPKPFGKGIILWGEPIFPPKKQKDPSLDNFKETIEKALKRTCKIADDEIDVPHV